MVASVRVSTNQKQAYIDADMEREMQLNRVKHLNPLKLRKTGLSWPGSEHNPVKLV